MEEKNFNIGTRIEHPKYGIGVISKNDTVTFKVIFIRGGEIEFSKLNAEFDVIDFQEMENQIPKVSLKEMEIVLKTILDKYNGLQYKVPLGKKWEGGTIILQPGNRDLKPKEIPVDAFFHKIVMMRDRLRVLEQNINSHPVLTDEEKLNIQQYITRCYGTMTTFNILFDDKEDFFIGNKS
ncbi:MAG: hypothetical protein RBS29_02730 [Bacteroidales bacterium]|jgi:hypothetical protein|nr:hypothetical protein [Bacteroidales bacterium]